MYKEEILTHIVILIHTILFLIYSDVFQELDVTFLSFLGLFVIFYFGSFVLAVFFTPITVIEVFILDLLISLFRTIYNLLIKKKKII